MNNYKPLSILGVLLCGAILSLFVACANELPSGTDPVMENSGASEGGSSAMSVGGSASVKAPKVDICHREGNGSFHLINVSGNAEPAHRAHGDAAPGEPVPGVPDTIFGEHCELLPVNSEPPDPV